MLRLGEEQGPSLAPDGLGGDDALADILPRGDLVHHVQQDVLDDGAQPPRPRLVCHGPLGGRLQSIVGEDQLHAVQGEEPLVLLDDGVPGLRQDADQHLLVQGVHADHHRQAPHELGDQAVLQQVVGDDQAEQLRRGEFLLLPFLAPLEAQGAPLHHPLGHDLVQALEGAPADEEDVRRVQGDELLVGVLAPPLRRDVGHGALDDLEEGLLHPLPRDVAGDGGVVAALAGRLVNLVNVDNPLGRPGQVAFGGLDEVEEDVLHILADVARLRQGRGVGDGEGDIQDSGQGLGQEGLPAARGADEQDVALLELHVVGPGAGADPLVVVVDRHGEDLLGPILSDDVLIQLPVDLLGGGRPGDDEVPGVG